MEGGEGARRLMVLGFGNYLLGVDLFADARNGGKLLVLDDKSSVIKFVGVVNPAKDEKLDTLGDNVGRWDVLFSLHFRAACQSGLVSQRIDCMY